MWSVCTVPCLVDTASHYGANLKGKLVAITTINQTRLPAILSGLASQGNQKHKIMDIQPEQLTEIIEALGEIIRAIEGIRSAISAGGPFLCFCIIFTGMPS